jgi:signal transduction histidine kinase
MIVLAFLVPLGLLVRTIAQDRALNDAERTAQALAPVLATVQDPTSVAAVVDGINVNGADVGAVSVFLPDGTVLGAPATADDAVALARRGRAFSTGIPGGTQVLVPVVGADDQVSVVSVVVPEDRQRRGVVAAWVLLAMLGLVLVLVAVALADRLARSIVRPIGELADVAERLGQGDLEARVHPHGPSEVVEVGDTLNQLASRIEGLLEAQRESAADLSHRLRTPVTALRLDADGLADPRERGRIGADVDALARAVDRLIIEARRPGAALIDVGSDLVAVTDERVRFWSALADDQGRSFTLSLPDRGCPVAVGTDDLEAVLDAVLNNLLAHTPEGTAFHVRVTADPEGGGSLVVEDDGPGWPADRDMLVRGASGGESTGLGLDIVRSTAEGSGGSVVLGAAPSGGARLEAVFGPPRGQPVEPG